MSVCYNQLYYDKVCLAPVIVVIARWFKDLFVISITFRPHYTIVDNF
jgi:hypothetical protein